MFGSNITCESRLGATAAVKATLNLPLLQSRYFVENCAKGWLFVVASFDEGEPLVHGFGESAADAWSVARSTNAPDSAVLCKRIVSNDPVWQSATGQIVTLEDLQTVRKD